MNKNKISKQTIDFLKERSTLILWFVFLIISAFTFLKVFPDYKDPNVWYITFAFVAMFMTMEIFEIILLFADTIKKTFSLNLKNKPKPKVFEFGFFLSIFIATISASYVIALIFQPGIEEKDILEIIRQYFWFFGLYGVSIAFGIYHYLFRLDDDNVKEEKNKGEGGDYMELGLLGKIGLSCIFAFFIILGFIAFLSVADTIIHSITIGLLTVGIALVALDLSNSTDKKIRNQMNGLFLQNLNFIEETRTYYNGHNYDEELLSWKTLQGVIIAWGLNKKIRKKIPITPMFQDQLVRYFGTTLKCLFEGLEAKGKKWMDLKPGQIGNFAKAYAMVEDFYAEDKTWISLKGCLSKLSKDELNDFNIRKDKEKQNLQEF